MASTCHTWPPSTRKQRQIRPWWQALVIADIESPAQRARIALEVARHADIRADVFKDFGSVDAARRTREADLDLAVKEFQLVSARITALLATANCAL